MLGAKSTEMSMSPRQAKLKNTIIKLERRIARQVIWSALPVFPHTFRGRRFDKNAFVRELLTVPMNYWRCLETPLTAWGLQAEPGEIVLDLGSPKVLAWYLALQGCSVIASDISNYFVDDLRQLRRELSITPLFIALADGQKLPLSSGSVDRAYSISVLEHIPGCGDAVVMAEVCRVLKPGGTFCLTVPFYSRYVEEFRHSMYWEKFSVHDERGVFFQRRYDLLEMKERLFNASDLEPESILFMAEKPLVKPGLREDLVFEENCHRLNRRILSILAVGFSSIPVLRIPIPMLRYLVQASYSHRYHYFTEDAADQNVRGVFIRLCKKRLDGSIDR